MLFRDIKQLLNLALFDELNELRELPHKILIHGHKLPGPLKAMLDYQGIFQDFYMMGEGRLGETMIESPAGFFFFFQKLPHGIHPHRIPERFHNKI